MCATQDAYPFPECGYHEGRPFLAYLAALLTTDPFFLSSPVPQTASTAPLQVLLAVSTSDRPGLAYLFTLISQEE